MCTKKQEHSTKQIGMAKVELDRKASKLIVNLSSELIQRQVKEPQEMLNINLLARRLHGTEK